MTSVSVKVFGIDGAVEQLERLGDFVEAPFPVVADPIHDFTTERIGRQFATQGREFGTPWAPISRGWRRTKREFGLSTDVLKATTRLRNAWVFGNHPAHIFEAGDDFMEMGVGGPVKVFNLTSSTGRRMFYRHDPGFIADVHQFGRGGNVARPQFAIDAKLTAGVARIFDEAVAGIADGS